jgi:hypothetical protein
MERKRNIRPLELRAEQDLGGRQFKLRGRHEVAPSAYGHTPALGREDLVDVEYAYTVGAEEKVVDPADAGAGEVTVDDRSGEVRVEAEAPPALVQSGRDR